MKVTDDDIFFVQSLVALIGHDAHSVQSFSELSMLRVPPGYMDEWLSDQSNDHHGNSQSLVFLVSYYD